MDSFLGEALGYFAGICTAITFLPQTIQTIRTNNIEGLSLGTYTIYVLGMLAWILYGVYLHSIQMIIFNAVSLFFALIILYKILKSKK